MPLVPRRLRPPLRSSLPHAVLRICDRFSSSSPPTAWFLCSLHCGARPSLALDADSYGCAQFDWLFNETRQELTVVGAGDALNRDRVYGQISALIDLEPEKAFVVFDPQRRKCFVPVKAEPIECDEKVCPEDRRIDETAESSREHHEPKIGSQSSRQVARQNEQDDQECEDVHKRVRDPGRYTFGPVFMIGEVDEGCDNAERDQQWPRRHQQQT